MSSGERNRPIPQRDIFWIFLGLVLLAALAVFLKRWFSDDAGASLEHFVRHPVFVFILWAAMSWSIYRRYKAAKIEDHHGA